MSEKPQQPAAPATGELHPKAKGHEAPTPPAHSRPEHAPAPETAKGSHADELQRLNDALKQAKDHYLRTVAEFENAKKRLHREKEEFVKYAAESMARELLPIVDSLDQALVAVDKQSDPQAIIKGVHLIYRQLLGLLEKEGVKRIPTVGEPFDPHHHEAVAQVDTTDGTADETIVEQVQVGYTMHGKVIRPAMVKVAKSTATRDKQQVTRDEQQTEDNTGHSQEGEVPHG